MQRAVRKDSVARLACQACHEGKRTPLRKILETKTLSSAPTLVLQLHRNTLCLLALHIHGIVQKMIMSTHISCLRFFQQANGPKPGR